MSSNYQRFYTQAPGTPCGIAQGFPVPGPQSAGADQIAARAFFASDWRQVQAVPYDYIVIGTGPAGVAFVDRILGRNPQARILVLERGGYWLPVHYQMLPMAFQAMAGSVPATYPWTRSAAMATGGHGLFQAGAMPVLGGRSTCWSGWCPAPEPTLLRGWPEELVAVTQKPQFWSDARAFLHVTTADRIDDSVYGGLQRQLDLNLQENFRRFVPSALDAFPVPIAAGDNEWQGAKYYKFSTVGALLGLQQKHKSLAAQGRGQPLAIVERCTVERLLHDGQGMVTALQTSRGPLAVGNARIVLAMGTIPPATLLMNSFGALLPNAGKRYTGHFMSHLAARVKRSAFKELAGLELGAHYLHGRADNGLQYHVQVSAFASRDPERDAAAIACEAPDAAAMASQAQLRGSEDHVLFVCAALGEVCEQNEANWIRLDGGADPAANVTLQLQTGPLDERLWDVLDEAACQTVAALASRGAGATPPIEYWVDTGPSEGCWQAERPHRRHIRLPVIVHEASTLWMGADPATSVVGLDYRPHGVRNVYVTGAGLFRPRARGTRP